MSIVLATLSTQLHRVEAAELSPRELITQAATKYGVSQDHLYKTLFCESGGFIDPAIHNGNGENSWGYAQFNLPTDLKTALGATITKEVAIDPYQAIDAAAFNMSIGNQTRWTCWVKGNKEGWPDVIK